MSYRWGIGLLAACALALAPVPGASASVRSRSGHVVGGTGGAATLTTFEALDCPDDFESHPANGIDAMVFDLEGGGGRVLAVQWTSIGINNNAYMRTYTDDCERRGLDFLVASGSAYSMPPGARWLAIIPGAGTVITAFTVS